MDYNTPGKYVSGPGANNTFLCEISKFGNHSLTSTRFHEDSLDLVVVITSTINYE